MMVKDLVPSHLKGKSFFNGKTPFEILVFQTQEEFEKLNTENEIKRHVMARLSSYDYAIDSARRIAEMPSAPAVIIVRA